MLSPEPSEHGGSGEPAEIFAHALTRFGHESLRPGQSEAIADVFAGRPVIAGDADGGGSTR